MSCIYNSKKSFSSKLNLHLEKQKKINFVVNSASFGWIVVYTIHSQIYLFWISKCKSNLKEHFSVLHI
jgi:hypothetical protein